MSLCADALRLNDGLLPGHIGVYAALCAGTAFLIVGHRSVYRLGRRGSASEDHDDAD